MNENISNDEKEVQIGAIIKKLWSWKARIIIATIISTCIGVAIAYFAFPASYTTSIQVAMQFDGIANWRNPDGSPFDPSQIIAPSILSSAAKKACPEKTFKNISKFTSIEPIIPFEIQNKLKAAKKKQEDYQYFPTQFKISITTKNNTEMTPKEKSEILSSLCQVYREYFGKKFGGVELKEFLIDKEFMETSEYLDIINMLKLMTNNLISFIDSRIAKAGKFRSSQTGMTFSQIKDNMLFFSNVQIRNVEALIRKLKIARDKQTLINYLEVDIRNKEMEKAKAQYQANAATRLLEMERFKQVIKSGEQKGAENLNQAEMEPRIFTTLTLDSTIIDNLKKSDYIPQLVETILKSETTAKNCDVDIEYIKKDIEEFSGEASTGKVDIGTVEKEIEKIHTNLRKWTEKLMQLDDEYMQTLLCEVIRPINLPENAKDIPKFFYLVVLFSICLPFFLALLSAFLQEEINS